MSARLDNQVLYGMSFLKVCGILLVVQSEKSTDVISRSLPVVFEDSITGAGPILPAQYRRKFQYIQIAWALVE